MTLGASPHPPARPRDIRPVSANHDEHPTPHHTSSAAGDLILVVDDDPALRDLVVSVLSLGRFRTREAPTGEDALDAVRDERPSAVLLDVRLPGISGYE